jgi:hypothetical protein
VAKKITIRIDDELARKIDELAEKTQIPKVRLTKQAYTLLIALYNSMKDTYADEIVDLNFISLLKNNNIPKRKKEKKTD